MYGETGEKLGPVFFQLLKSGVHFCCGVVAVDHGKGRSFSYNAQRLPFVILGILHIAEKEDVSLALAGFQGDFQVMGTDGIPAAGYGIFGFAGQDNIRFVSAVVDA